MLPADAVQLLALQAERIERIQNISCHDKRCKHGKHNTERQRLGKALYGAGSQEQQHAGCDQRRDISVDDCGQRLVKTDLDRILHGLAGGKLLADTRKDQHVCIHRHTDGKNDTCHAGQGQCHIKALQEKNYQRRVSEQCDCSSNTGNQIDNNHEHCHNGKSDDSRL